MAAVDIEMVSKDAIKVGLRPCVSPIGPKTTAPVLKKKGRSLQILV